MNGNKFIKDIVKIDNITIDQNSTISEAIELMSKNREGVIVVLDEKSVVGILTERDLVKLLNDKIRLEQKVINIAKKSVISININRTIEYALNILIDNNIRRLVIVDDNDKFLGIITQEMVISYLETEHYKVDLKVSQVVSSLPQNIITIDINSTLQDVITSLFDNSIGSVLISDSKKIVGIITERDLVSLTSRKTSLSTPVEDIMSKPVIYVSINDSIRSVVQTMDLKRIRRVLVNDEFGNTVSMIGTRDIIKNIKGNYGLYIETKLKYTKQALNSINEVIFEIYKNECESLLIQWGNKSALERYGESIVDKPITVLVDEKKLSKMLKKLNKSDKVDNYRLKIGNYRYRVSINQSCHEQSILLVCKDITETLKLKKDIKEQKSIFKNLFKNSSNGVLILENGKFIDCNKAIIKILKYGSKKDILNLHPAQLAPKYQPNGEDSFQRFNEMIRIAMKSGTNIFEYYHTRANGENFWSEIVLTKMIQRDREIIHVVWRDIDDKKQTEFKLEQLTKHLEQRVKEEVEHNRVKDQQMIHQSRLAQMGEMISMIAHQWRQPLSAISSTANNLMLKLMMDDINKEICKEEISLIANYSQHLSKTIDDFRDFFKEDKEKEITTLEEIINSTLDIVRTSIENKNIKIITNFSCHKRIKSYPNELK